MIDTTLILLCHNRPNTFLRAIKFYEKFFNSLKVCILISGKVSKNNYKTNIKHNNLKIFFIKKDFHEKIEIGLSKVSTKYVVLCGIDDFIFPHSINKCKNFLNKNKDYISCHGRYYLHKSFSELSNNKSFLNDISILSKSISENKAFNRSLHYLKLKNPASTNIYALFKSIEIKFIIKVVNNYVKKFKKKPTITFEIMFCLLSHILGKTKHLEILYSTKEKHKNIPDANFTLFEEKVLISNYLKFISKNVRLFYNISNKNKDIIKYFLEKKFDHIVNQHSKVRINLFIKILKKFRLYNFIKKVYFFLKDNKKKDFKYLSGNDKKEILKLSALIYKFPKIENESNLSRKLYVKKK